MERVEEGRSARGRQETKKTTKKRKRSDIDYHTKQLLPNILNQTLNHQTPFHLILPHSSLYLIPCAVSPHIPVLLR